ncbi:glycosyl transferase [Spongiactinospora gelatinilytica]|uniref:Glycosyl transferase n=1 Tax=Spongiactinospora gelatinilytica TaxID=2666298 RepID=A0A2W2H7T9_9ACTN|nr:polysaccharide deacetylase family protein [Spongiactinospora gelatinilytica]PZG42307.1 glycosyl transferase [Spongiactinospora gelatinilytica]
MAGSIVNITVHGIGPVVRELDPGEDQVWVEVEQFERMLDAAVGRGDVRITFDDGNASDVEIALPRLLERGLTAEFFVCAGLLGEPGRVDAGGVRELAAAGMRIGSHGWSHRDWRLLSPEDVEREMIEAGHVLADLVGHPVSRVAVPFGSYDRHVLRRMRDAKITRAYTSDGGRARPGTWLQTRTSIGPDLDQDWLDRVLNGTPSVYGRARGSAARAFKRLRG